jgi:FOG: PKD repeat
MKVSKKALLGILVCAAMVVTFQGIAYALGAASFTSSGDGIIAAPNDPVEVQFTDTSAGATSWQWNFGDGSINNTTQNPTHNFLWAYNYLVTLTASDVNGPAPSVQNEVNVLLKVNGSAANAYDFSVAELYGNCTLIEPDPISVPYHKHNDETTYYYTGTGLLLSDLVNLVATSTPTSITLIGSDGYTRTVAYDEDSTMLFFDGSILSNGIRYINTDDEFAQNWVSKLVSITLNA